MADTISGLRDRIAAYLRGRQYGTYVSAETDADDLAAIVRAHMAEGLARHLHSEANKATGIDPKYGWEHLTENGREHYRAKAKAALAAALEDGA